MDRLDPGQSALDDRYAQIAREFGPGFTEYHESTTTVFRPSAKPISINQLPAWARNSIAAQIRFLMSGNQTAVSFSPDILQSLTREEIASLEAEGIVFSGVSIEHPEGGIFVKDLFRKSLEIEPESLDPVQQVQKETRLKSLQAINAVSFLRPATGLITRRPSSKIPDNLQGLPRIATNSLAAAVYKDGQWSDTHVLPDGEWLSEGFDSTANNYGQAAFEGMVASKKNGRITIFRPEENATRFIKSCCNLKIPPISVSQFIQAVMAAAKNNTEFVPEGGKLYIRPVVIGLKGGTGVKPAKQYLFAVEVSPFGEYIPPAREEASVETSQFPGIDIKCVTFRRSDSSRDKVAGSYAPVFPLKEKAKAEGFQDILLVTPEGRLQECSSSNFFTVKRKGDTFQIFTPTLVENILPGITRKSLLQLLRDPKVQAQLKRKIKVFDQLILPEARLMKATGAFSSGTAAGITNIRKITNRKGVEKVFDDTETQAFIKDLYDLLSRVRRGEVEGYENWVKEL